MKPENSKNLYYIKDVTGMFKLLIDTEFIVKNGHYEFIGMVFGLKDMRSTCQRVINSILMTVQSEQGLIYIDDITVHSNRLIACQKSSNDCEKYN